MIEGIEKYEITQNFKIRVVKSKKFKTDLIGLFLLRPLNDKEASQLALISRLLTRGSMKYKSAKLFNDKLDEMYGAVFISDVVKYGEKITMHCKIQFPNKRLVESENILQESMKFLKEAVFNVYHDGNSFNSEFFEQEKLKLIEEINSRVNDKITYAVDRCIEIMCEKEAFSVYHYGSVETVKSLENEEVYSYFTEILKSSPIDILTIGDMDFDEIHKLVIKNFSDVIPAEVVEIPCQQFCEEEKEVKYVSEKMNVNQGKLTLGFRTHIRYDDPLYEPAVLFATILGGGGNSTLFRNIREKESLCYYIFSKIEKFKSVMLIASGIEIENYDRTLKLIVEEVDKLKRGEFTEDDINVAKEVLVSSVKSLTDYPNSFINYYYSRELTGSEYNENRIIDEVMNVTKEEIMEAGNKFILDTVHFIKGDELNENQ
ncbi:MAG: insulinase family protein [Clostridiales bacterium]|nr:insulinase family protein [Clostridiales bacterium]